MSFEETDYRQIEQSADQLVQQEQDGRLRVGLPPLPADLEGRLRNVFLACLFLSRTGLQKAMPGDAAAVLSLHWSPRWRLYEDQDYQRIARMALNKHQRVRGAFGVAGAACMAMKGT